MGHRYLAFKVRASALGQGCELLGLDLEEQSDSLSFIFVLPYIRGPDCLVFFESSVLHLAASVSPFVGVRMPNRALEPASRALEPPFGLLGPPWGPTPLEPRGGGLLGPLPFMIDILHDPISTALP